MVVEIEDGQPVQAFTRVLGRSGRPYLGGSGARALEGISRASWSRAVKKRDSLRHEVIVCSSDGDTCECTPRPPAGHVNYRHEVLDAERPTSEYHPSPTLVACRRSAR